MFLVYEERMFGIVLLTLFNSVSWCWFFFLWLFAKESSFMDPWNIKYELQITMLYAMFLTTAINTWNIVSSISRSINSTASSFFNSSLLSKVTILFDPEEMMILIQMRVEVTEWMWVGISLSLSLSSPEASK
jgi:hypothetical protein